MANPVSGCSDNVIPRPGYVGLAERRALESSSRRFVGLNQKNERTPKKDKFSSGSNLLPLLSQNTPTMIKIGDPRVLESNGILQNIATSGCETR